MRRIVRQFANATSMAHNGAWLYSQRFCEFPHCAHHHGFIYRYYSFFTGLSSLPFANSWSFEQYCLYGSIFFVLLFY